MKFIFVNLILFFAVAGHLLPAQSAPSTLIQNVQIFDGENVIATSGAVRVQAGKIIDVFNTRSKALPEDIVIDGNGQFLMPGLIDAHVHVAWAFPFSKSDFVNETYATVTAVANASAMLNRGFTTVRDTAGVDYGFAQAIEDGVVPGPRIVFTGRSISQTGGHADHRKIKAKAQSGMIFGFGSTIADGIAEVTKAAREELRRGAFFIKIHAGGGVSSPTDPLHSVQYTAEEISAVVQVAADRGTYVAAHAYTAESITRALNAGVKTIEHGNFIDKKAAQLAAQKGAFVVPNLVTYWAMDNAPHVPAYMKSKNKMALDAMGDALTLLKDAGVKVAFGTDLIADMHPLQNQEFLLRAHVFSPLEILRQATSVNASLIALSGPNNSFGALGVIKKGAVADLLLIDGNPIDDISLMARPMTAISMIMKNGEVVR